MYVTDSETVITIGTKCISLSINVMSLLIRVNQSSAGYWFKIKIPQLIPKSSKLYEATSSTSFFEIIPTFLKCVEG